NDTWVWVPLPAVTSVTPSSFSATDKASIIITGANFDSVLSVKIGSETVTSFTVDSPTQITITSLPSSFSKSNEPVDITVITSAGHSLPSAASKFTYHDEQKIEDPIPLAPIIKWTSA